MPHVPVEKPDTCPVCETAYSSVTEHAEGLMVGLNRNERYRRVCFEPHAADGEARPVLSPHARASRTGLMLISAVTLAPTLQRSVSDSVSPVSFLIQTRTTRYATTGSTPVSNFDSARGRISSHRYSQQYKTPSPD